PLHERLNARRVATAARARCRRAQRRWAGWRRPPGAAARFGASRSGARLEPLSLLPAAPPAAGAEALPASPAAEEEEEEEEEESDEPEEPDEPDEPSAADCSAAAAVSRWRLRVP